MCMHELSLRKRESMKKSIYSYINFYVRYDIVKQHVREHDSCFYLIMSYVMVYVPAL